MRHFSLDLGGGHTDWNCTEPQHSIRSHLLCGSTVSIDWTVDSNFIWARFCTGCLCCCMGTRTQLIWWVWCLFKAFGRWTLWLTLINLIKWKSRIAVADKCVRFNQKKLMCKMFSLNIDGAFLQCKWNYCLLALSFCISIGSAVNSS